MIVVLLMSPISTVWPLMFLTEGAGALHRHGLSSGFAAGRGDVADFDGFSLDIGSPRFRASILAFGQDIPGLHAASGLDVLCDRTGFGIVAHTATFKISGAECIKSALDPLRPGVVEALDLAESGPMLEGERQEIIAPGEAAPGGFMQAKRIRDELVLTARLQNLRGAQCAQKLDFLMLVFHGSPPIRACFS